MLCMSMPGWSLNLKECDILNIYKMKQRGTSANTLPNLKLYENNIAFSPTEPLEVLILCRSPDWKGCSTGEESYWKEYGNKIWGDVRNWARCMPAAIKYRLIVFNVQPLPWTTISISKSFLEIFGWGMELADTMQLFKKVTLLRLVVRFVYKWIRDSPTLSMNIQQILSVHIEVPRSNQPTT